MGTMLRTIFALVSLYPLYFTCEISATSTLLMSNPFQDDLNICDFVYCGKGTCHLSSTELYGFRCDCESGWKKPNIGSVELPPCVFPNCTVNINCGNGSPPPPSVLTTQVSDPCLLNFCGDGTCVSHGFDFSCQCNQGSANLLDDPKLFCFKKCTLGGDCNGLDFLFGPSPPTKTPPPPATYGTDSSGPAGSGERELHMLAMTILTLIYHVWI